MVGSKKQNILLLTVICCATLALISITWAAFSSTLKLSGQASVAAQSWDIDFTNTVGTKWTTAQSLTGTKTNLAELPTSSSGAFGLPLDQTASGFLGSLRMSGDKITYTWYVQNFGTFEAKYSISGLISTGKYLSGSNVDISCNTSDNSSDKTFCNNYVKTTLTIDGVVADASSSYTLAKAGETGDSSTLVLTIEIIGENQIYTATAKAMDNYFNSYPTMLRSDLEMLDNSNDLSISVKGLILTGTQSVAETTPVVVSTTEDTCTSKINTEYLFDYTGDEQTFTVPCDGTYKLEVWGAQGYSAPSSFIGGYGAYAVGNYTATAESILYVTVGQQGNGGMDTNYSSYSNGGIGGSGDGLSYAGSGGGSTHIMTTTGLLENQNSNLETVLIVAAGGGSGTKAPDNGWAGFGGHAGGYIGNSGVSAEQLGVFTPGGGATQSSGGTAGNACVAGNFGKGSIKGNMCAAGGGGLYGGGGSWGSAGGGGSSYIGNSLLSNKAMYCYNCTESSEESTKTISVTDVSETATSNYAKLGNGYAKITYLG